MYTLDFEQEAYTTTTDTDIIAGIISTISDETFNRPTVIKFFVKTTDLSESERILTWYIDINNRYRRLM
jgi:hypothetical protein